MNLHHKYNRIFIILALLLVLLAAGLIFALVWGKASSIRSERQEPAYTIGFGSDTVRARVLDVLEEGTITLGDITQPYQILLVRIMEGPHEGEFLQIDYGQRQIRPAGLTIRPGDQLLITVSVTPDGILSGYFTDFVRSTPLLWLLGTFVVFSILISGWKGVRSLLGMAFSLLVIIAYIIPQILNGRDPVLVSVSGAFVLLAVTLYLTYGWTLKTHAAVAGTFISLLLTGLLAVFFVNLTRLTGFGSEDALFLVQQSTVKINLRGMVLGGILIGALGVLDDLVITQASAVFELRSANPQQGWRALFRSAMRIGQDHVAATVNTLVLAYAGAALPTLLLFTLSGEQYAYLVNLEFVTEEIVRTLIGSLGLISAVPVTTLLASLIASRVDKLHQNASWLGPPDGHTRHQH
ncbi:MAG: YibE/F family protein [Anaerolineales bacterium]|nr:YibE/F family protein [Anaerolineales bacterium]